MNEFHITQLSGGNYQNKMAWSLCWMLFCVIPYQVHSIPYVSEDVITVSAYVGEEISVRCAFENIPPEYPILLYHDQRRQYLTNDEEIYDYAPEDLKNRLSVNCYRLRSLRGVCSVTIKDTTTSDNGTYQCGYTDALRVYLPSAIIVKLKNPDPPSDNSPICEIFSVGADGTYVASPSGHGIGDSIYLGCRVRKTSVIPTLLWQRGYDSHAIEMDPLKGLSVKHEVVIAREHIGVEFFCIMNHPNLVSLRNCSVMPLAEIPSSLQSTPFSLTTNKSSLSTSSPTTSSILNTSLTGATHVKPFKTVQIVNTQPTASSREQSLKVPIVISVLLTTFVLGAGLMLFAVWRKRSRKLKIPSIPSYEMTFERNCSITPEYAVVHAPDSIDKSNQKNRLSNFKSVDALAPQLPLEKDENCNGNIRNSSHLYESNDIGIDESSSNPDYETFHIPQSQQEDQSQLMYADLDFPENSNDLNNVRYCDNQDATVYADIKGTL